MSCTNKGQDRDAEDRLIRALRRPHGAVQSTPGTWVSVHMNRPRRHENRRLCQKVFAGEDPDGIVWPVGARRPHLYYW